MALGQFWFPKAKPREIKSALVPSSHRAHIGSIRCHFTRREYSYYVTNYHSFCIVGRSAHCLMYPIQKHSSQLCYAWPPTNLNYPWKGLAQSPCRPTPGLRRPSWPLHVWRTHGSNLSIVMHPSHVEQVLYLRNRHQSRSSTALNFPFTCICDTDGTSWLPRVCTDFPPEPPWWVRCYRCIPLLNFAQKKQTDDLKKNRWDWLYVRGIDRPGGISSWQKFSVLLRFLSGKAK